PLAGCEEPRAGVCACTAVRRVFERRVSQWVAGTSRVGDPQEHPRAARLHCERDDWLIVSRHPDRHDVEERRTASTRADDLHVELLADPTWPAVEVELDLQRVPSR